MEQRAAESVDDLRTWIQDGELDRVDDAWMEFASDPASAAAQLGVLIELAGSIVERGYGQRALSLLELLVPALEHAPAAERVRLRHWLIELAPANRAYVQAFIEEFESTYGAATPERAFFDVVQLGETSDPGGAARRLRKLLRYRPGTCVFHPSGWGMGEIREIDALLKQVRVDLEEKRDHRMNIAVIDTTLEHVPDGSFRALLYKQPAELAKLASENPPEVIAKLLETFGNARPLKDIKARLVPRVIAESSWAKWWAGAKSALRDSGFFRVADRAPYTVEKLDAELSYEDDLAQRFDSPRWADRLAAARLILKAGPKKYPNAYDRVEAELQRVATVPGAAEAAANAERGTMRADKSKAAEQILVAGILLARTDPDGAGGAALNAALAQLDAGALIAGLEKVGQSDEIRVVLESLAANDGDADRILRLAFLSRSDSVRECVVALLSERDPQRIEKWATELAGSPRLSPDGICWLLEKRLDPSHDSIATRVLSSASERDILVRLIDLVEYMLDRGARQSAGVKETFRRLESILWTGRGKFFRAAVKHLTPDQLLRLSGRLVACQDYFAKHALKMIEIVSAALPEPKDKKRQWWDPEKIYVTEVGLQRRTDEFREITEEKLPAIFDAIGRAREFGDLSENAEYTSALEERDLLTKRAAAIEDELKKAVVLHPEDVRPGRVALGSRVRVQDLDAGRELVYSVLGPWDGNPDDGVLSYLSPLGKIFLGRSAGDEFVAQLPGGDRRFRVLEVRSHFEAKRG